MSVGINNWDKPTSPSTCIVVISLLSNLYLHARTHRELIHSSRTTCACYIPRRLTKSRSPNKNFLELSETDEEWLLVFLIFLFGRGNIATIQYEKEIRSRDGKKNIQQDIISPKRFIGQTICPRSLPFWGVFCCWGCCCWAGVWNSGSIHHVSQLEDQVM